MSAFDVDARCGGALPGFNTHHGRHVSATSQMEKTVRRPHTRFLNPFLAIFDRYRTLNMGTKATSLELQSGHVVHRGDAGDIEARIPSETTGKKAIWRSKTVMEWFCKMKGGSAKHPPSPPATDVSTIVSLAHRHQPAGYVLFCALDMCVSTHYIPCFFSCQTCHEPWALYLRAESCQCMQEV